MSAPSSFRTPVYGDLICVRAPWLLISVSRMDLSEAIKNPGRLEKRAIVIFVETVNVLHSTKMTGQMVIAPGEGCVVIPSVAANELGTII